MCAHSERDTPEMYTMISSGMRVCALIVRASCFNELHTEQSSASDASTGVQNALRRVAGTNKLIVGRLFSGVSGHDILSRENGFVTYV